MDKILIVEDDSDIAEGLRLFLNSRKFSVDIARTGREARNLFKTYKHDIVILDTLLPDVRGNELCREFKKTSKTGVIFLTALSSKDNIMQGYSSGADDYIVKPFDMDILMCRIDAVLRRTKNQKTRKESSMIRTIKGIRFDLRKSDVLKEGRFIGLTPSEFQILYMLAWKGGYCSDDEVLEQLYGQIPGLVTRTLSVHISNIRKKLLEAGYDTITIIRKHKEGYELIHE